MKRLTLLTLALATIVFRATPSLAHCEIPCGIYDDKMRLDMIDEHITTIEKSMKQIVELSGAGTVNYNQLVRWVTNKEAHATEIQGIATQYFLTQRIKSGQEHYTEHLEMLHQMLVFAMKCKQTTDQANVSKLRDLAAAFRASYLGPEGEAHTH